MQMNKGKFHVQRHKISNIGFDITATHTTDVNRRLVIWFQIVRFGQLVVGNLFTFQNISNAVPFRGCSVGNSAATRVIE